jgi:hypothetical protein
MKHFQYIGLTIILLCRVVVAQDASFTASVDRNRVAMGEQFQLTFTLSGQGGGSNFRPPSFNDFLVLSGPNQSTNMQIINGAVSSSVSYTYIIQPRSEGKFVIGSATINVGGKQLRSQPITIEVSKGAAAQSQQSQRQQQQGGSVDISKQIGDNLFLRVSVDRSKVYQGEQITVNYKLYWRVSLAGNPSVGKVPALTGFWSEDLETPRQIQITREIVNGKQYNVAVLKKVALFPQHDGTLTIDPMEVECAVQVKTNRRRSNDIFDQFFGNDPFFNDPFFGGVTTVNYKTKSQPVRITVQSLPATGIPPGFGGAVGKYTMDAWLDKRQTTTNDAVTLRVKISGRGNLRLLEAPAVVVPPDIERYDPKISDNVSNQGDRIAGSRTFEYLLLPRHAGEQRIPPITFAYFDPEKKNYVALHSPEFVLTVEKGTEAAPEYATGISKEDVKLLGEDIRFIKSGNLSLRRAGELFIGSPLFVVLLFSPILGFVGFVVYAKRRERLMGNVVLLRNRKARKMAQRRLVEAKKLLTEKKKEEFYTEVSRALWGYVGDKLGIPPSDLSVDTARITLESRKVSQETVVHLTATIEQCEFARFAPSEDSLQMDGIYNDAVVLISTIEEQLR